MHKNPAPENYPVHSKNPFRSHHCNQLTITHVDHNVTLAGWVHSKRNHGGVAFIMLRDHYGLTQLVSALDTAPSLHKKLTALALESVIHIHGTVTLRSPATQNPNLPTGKIEIIVTKLIVLAPAQPLPFEINKNSPANDDDTIAYRYLYLRRPAVKAIFAQRSALTMLIRNFLTQKGFLEIETPLLTKTTPEGARDFLVPARLYPGEFYALPQSPQQYKQLLMVAGFDKYFQIARALRDEDSRADRQPEHTQLDLEMAFVSRDNIIALLEELVLTIHTTLFPNLITILPPKDNLPPTSTPSPHHTIPRISYHDALRYYGTDKPDLRFNLKITTITPAFQKTTFKIFQNILHKNGAIASIVIPNKADESRKNLDLLITHAQNCNLSGLVWAIPPSPAQPTWRSSSGKIISPSEFAAVKTLSNAKTSDLILIAADPNPPSLYAALGKLRLTLAHLYNLIPPQCPIAFAFITDFPLLAYNTSEKRLDPLHHMFVLPQTTTLHYIQSLINTPLAALLSPALKQKLDAITPLVQTELQKSLKINAHSLPSTQFDLVANGYELCSGSQRIASAPLQYLLMRLIGLAPQEIDAKFAHLLNAFSYGAPPHGGAAPGIDRLLMVFSQISNIRNVIAFPKTQRGQDLMMNSPSPANPTQLAELALKLDFAAMKPDREQYLKNIQTFNPTLF